MTMTSVWLCGVSAAVLVAVHPLRAQRVAPLGVVGAQRGTSAAVMPRDGDARGPRAARIATTVAGVGMGAYVGVVAVEVTKQATGRSSCSCDHGADYAGAAAGALALGSLSWWIAGHWFK